jgi:segregation and condensation protein B
MSQLRKTEESEVRKQAALRELRHEIEGKLEEQLPHLKQRSQTVVQETEEVREIDESVCKKVVESLLFASSKPLTVDEIRRVIKGYKASVLEKMILELQAEYEQQNRSFRVNAVAGGFEISTRPEYSGWIMKLELDKKSRRASLSALETLAILAYKQPVTRAEIEDLRGVDVSAVLANLLERDLIQIVGRKEVAGRPFLYGTTEKFLQHFGLKTLEDLPKISEIRELLENSINKDELFKTEKIVEEAPQTPPQVQEQSGAQ